MFTPIIVFIVLVLLASIKQINQYERGVKFTMGRFVGVMEPGWRLVIPIFQTYRKVDMRIKAVDVPDQNAITNDNISISVNAVIYYRVAAADRAIIAIENFHNAVSQYAQTTMRNMAGEVTLDQLLAGRKEIAEKIRATVDQETDEWGIKVDSVELKDISLPADMERTIAKQAEAEREKRAVIIKSEGERIAAENMALAAKTLSTADGALHLRTLQAINDLSSDQSNTIVFPIPVELLKAFTGYGKENKTE
jgi:regulator of protease activity HflC (stomatin/prohibitin superfamily)